MTKSILRAVRGYLSQLPAPPTPVWKGKSRPGDRKGESHSLGVWV